MNNEPAPSPGEELVARVRADLERLGLMHVTATYLPEKNVIRLAWPHVDGTATLEGVEFTATDEWLALMRPVLRAMAQRRQP